MPSFVERFKPRLDRLRTKIPTGIGVRSVTLTVRSTLFEGDLMTGGQTVVTDTVIGGPAGARYKVREVSAKEVVASGGKFQHGSLRVGPITPPYPGGAFTRDELLPPTEKGGDVLYGVTDSSGRTQWCELQGSDTLHDLHWYLVLNPTGTTPDAP